MDKPCALKMNIDGEQLRIPQSLYSNRTASSVAGAMLIGSCLITPSLVAAETNNAEQKKELGEAVVKAEKATALKPEKLSSPRYTTPLRDIPRTVTVIPEELIKQQNATTIQEALRNVPGIALQAGEGGVPTGDNLTIRGFEARNNFFVDGVRDLGNYTRDPFNYEQIEVSKGPSSTDTGRGTEGGSINLATKTAKLENKSDLGLTLGTDNLLRGTLDLNREIQAIEGAALRLNLLGHTADVPGRNHVDQQRWGIATSLAFGLGSDTVTTLNYMHLSQDNTPDYGLPIFNNRIPSGLDYDNWYGLTWRDYEHTDTDIFTAEVKHEINPDLNVRGLARYGRNYRDSAVTAPRPEDANDPSQGVRAGAPKTRDHLAETWTLAFDANYKIETGNIQHNLVGGTEYTVERNRNDARTGTTAPTPTHPDINNPNNGAKYPYTLTNGATTIGEATTLGVFLYDNIVLNDQWLLNGGLRYDHVDSKYNTGTATFSTTDDIFSWRSAVTYKPRENGSIYLAYGTSANPSIANNINLTDDTENLDPEKTNTFELGTKWDLLNERLGLSAAVFQTEKTNARMVDGVSGDTVLGGNVSIKGFELGLTGQVTDQWSIFAGYTYMDAEQDDLDPVDGRGEITANTPKHSFSIWNTFQVNDKLAISGGVQYVGDRENGRGFVAESYFTFDAGATYKINEDLSLQFNIYNIADERYVGTLGGGHATPGQGRSASIGVNYSF